VLRLFKVKLLLRNLEGYCAQGLIGENNPGFQLCDFWILLILYYFIAINDSGEGINSFIRRGLQDPPGEPSLHQLPFYFLDDRISFERVELSSFLMLAF
jgi:hypothetical protein